MSKHLYTFLPALPVSAQARGIHMLLAYWGYVLMCIHAGTHLTALMAKLGKKNCRSLIATGFLSYGFGLDPASEMWRTVGCGAAFCMLPLVGGWIIERITLLNLQMSLWLHR